MFLQLMVIGTIGQVGITAVRHVEVVAEIVGERAMTPHQHVMGPIVQEVQTKLKLVILNAAQVNSLILINEIILM